MNMLLNFLGSTTTAGGAVPQVVSNANPLPVSLSGGVGGLSVAGTVADSSAVGAQFPVTIGGVDYATGFAHRLNTDANGNLNVNVVAGGGSSTVIQGAPNAGGAASWFVQQGPGSTANPWTVQGPVASGVASTANPVISGGLTVTGATGTATNNQARTFNVDAAGNLSALQMLRLTTGADGIANTSLGFGVNQTNFGTSVLNVAAGYIFNGTSFDRITKPRTAARLPSSAASNNAVNVKTSPGTVFSITANITLALSTCYLKFFDNVAAPNPAAQNPLYVFPLNIVDAVFSPNLPAGGLYFPTGIAYAIVANPADLDNTAIAAAQITALNITFA